MSEPAAAKVPIRRPTGDQGSVVGVVQADVRSCDGGSDAAPVADESGGVST